MAHRHAADVLTVVFAKAPMQGRVKTRLVPMLGEAGAARLYRRLLQRAISTAVAARLGPVELHCAPHADHAWLQALAGRHGVRLRSQFKGDIGARMAHAFSVGLRIHGRVLLMGSDCPELQVADLIRASHALGRCDAVFAPAEDGGYPLVGLRRAGTDVLRAAFSDVPWSTGEVMAVTRRRLAARHISWRELRTVWDVDRPEDVVRLQTSGLLRRLDANVA